MEKRLRFFLPCFLLVKRQVTWGWDGSDEIGVGNTTYVTMKFDGPYTYVGLEKRCQKASMITVKQRGRKEDLMDGHTLLLYHIQKEGHIGQVGPKLFCIIIIVIGMVFTGRVSKMTLAAMQKSLGVGHLATRQLIHIGKV